MICLRFVTCNDPISYLIRTAENFWASHVEAVLPDGAGYLGAHADGGVQIRPLAYDKDTMTRQLFVAMTASDAVTEAFYDGLKSHIGEPYDFSAILGFVARTNLHSKQHAICSALQALELEKSGFFPGVLCRPPHEISPADLLLILTGRVEIKDAA